MNKIADQSKDSGIPIQSQAQLPIQPESDQAPDGDANLGDSIVTFRTDNNIDTELVNSPPWKRLKDTLSDPHALTSIALLLGIIGLSAAGGYLLGQGDRTNDFTPIMLMATVSGGTAESRVEAVSKPDVSSQDQPLPQPLLPEVTEQLGEMRAELLRLHTVFVHLAELAQLDDGEYDLESPLLEWKEQASGSNIDLLNRRIAHMSDNSSTLTSIFNLRRMAFDQKISGRPVVEGHKSSGFGYRTDPITGERVEHLGLDYSGPVGEPILALADGIVTFSGKNSGYGNLVELEHVGGLRTRYAHNQVNLVKPGVRVKKGEAIATLGSTGRSTGPHVHVEVRLDGSPMDPGFFVN